MSELSGNGSSSVQDKIAGDHAVTPGEFETDVKDVFADGLKNDMPVFNVSKDEFHQNMAYGRRRLRFKTDTSVQKYMKGTRYNRPFWIESDGYVRKVK
jgi:hypothetical protein